MSRIRGVGTPTTRCSKIMHRAWFSLYRDGDAQTTYSKHSCYHAKFPPYLPPCHALYCVGVNDFSEMAEDGCRYGFAAVRCESFLGKREAGLHHSKNPAFEVEREKPRGCNGSTQTSEESWCSVSFA